MTTTVDVAKSNLLVTWGPPGDSLTVFKSNLEVTWGPPGDSLTVFKSNLLVTTFLPSAGRRRMVMF